MAESDDADAPEDELDMQLDAIRDHARSPDKEPSLSGGSKGWIDAARQFEGASEDATVALLAMSPTDLLSPPSWIEGQAQSGEPDPLDGLKDIIDSGGSRTVPPVDTAAVPPTEDPTTQEARDRALNDAFNKAYQLSRDATGINVDPECQVRYDAATNQISVDCEYFVGSQTPGGYSAAQFNYDTSGAFISSE